MKLNKKQLKTLALSYLYNDKNSEYFQGLNHTLIALGINIEVQNEAFKIKNMCYKKEVEETEKLINKAYDKKEFKSNLINHYKDEIQFMDRLSNGEKKQLETLLNMF
jgi:hypothetical protein